MLAEWYEYKGYIVKRNRRVGKLGRGGHEGEIDIAAFNPVTKHLIHVEASVDADSWANREKRFSKKFEVGRRYIPTLFEGFDLPETIEQVALFAAGSRVSYQSIGGGRILFMSELMEDIFNEVKSKSILNDSIPEHYPILRTFQIISHFRSSFCRILCKKDI